jgi:hypothetical protein
VKLEATTAENWAHKSAETWAHNLAGPMAVQTVATMADWMADHSEHLWVLMWGSPMADYLEFVSVEHLVASTAILQAEQKAEKKGPLWGSYSAEHLAGH